CTHRCVRNGRRADLAHWASDRWCRRDALRRRVVTHDRPAGSDAWLRRMRAWGVRPARSKGQNFLLDAEVVERIADASGAGPLDRVLEIGPGLGILTEALLRRGATVTAIELDDTLAPRLEAHFRDNDRFRLVHGDATAIDPADIFEPGQS